jgi:hypothetical protein
LSEIHNQEADAPTPSLRHPAENYIMRHVKLLEELEETTESIKDNLRAAKEAGHLKGAILRTARRLMETSEARASRESIEAESDQQLRALGVDPRATQGDLFEPVLPPRPEPPRSAAYRAETPEESEMDPEPRGYVAYFRGAAAGENPHEAGTVENELWRSGWVRGFTESREAKNGDLSGTEPTELDTEAAQQPRRRPGRPRSNGASVH